MYSHSRSFGGGHSNNPPVSHYTAHHTPPSFHQGRNAASSSHLHVLQNPPQFSSGNPQTSPNRNQQYQPYYPSPASINMGQDVYVMNGNEVVGGGGSGGGNGSSNGNGNGMRPRTSGPVMSSSRGNPRSTEQASTPKSNSSSSDHRPNWGLIGRQLSQIAGDVSTSVRQNELVITLLERLIERVDGGGIALQGSIPPPSSRVQMVAQQEGEFDRAANRITTRRQQQQHQPPPPPPPLQHQEQQQQHPSEYDSISQDVSRSREESNIRLSGSLSNNTQQHVDPGPSQASTSHPVSSYLDNDLASSSFQFESTPQDIPHRTHYPPAINHRFDADIPPKRTPPTVSFMLSGDVDHPSHTSSSHAAAPPAHSFSTASNNRQHHSTSSSSQHQHSNINGNMPSSGNVTLDESYNRLPSPVFSDSAPADHEPPAALGLTHYYGEADRGSSPPTIHPEALRQHGMHAHHPPTTTAHPTIERQDSRGRLTVGQSAGMGSLEDAGLIPVSSTSSTSVTPAARPRQPVEVEGIEDQSMNTSVLYSTNDGDQSQSQIVEVANSDWKLWQTPKPPAVPLETPSKYRSMKQVKNERKEKTKRSISTIGRIPLKEYLEVGSDYKAVRRMARTVYNTWLALNVRLAKQDPDRLRACYHKLEYEYPILGDCEDHWKAKELMLQVIDNAIDEIAFHRRKEERKAQGQENGEATNDITPLSAAADNPNSNTNGEITLRRDATAADLYTNEDDRPNTRRRRGGGNVIRDRSNDETVANQSTTGNTQIGHQHEQNWETTGENANLFTQSSSTAPDQQSQPRQRRTQQTTAGWQ